MATSGTRTFTMTAAEIIEHALKQLSVIGANEAVSSEDSADSLKVLNLILKSLQTKGLNLWTRETAYVFLQSDTYSYTLTSSTNWATSYSTTTSTAAISSAATTWAVTSTAGMTVGDKIAIHVGSGTLEWTTIATIPSAISLTVAAGPSVDVASGARIFAYTSAPTDIPLRVLTASTLNLTSLAETPVTQKHLTSFERATNGTSDGLPNLFAVQYDLDSPKLRVYPATSDQTNILKITYQKELQDVTETSETLDIPRHWLQAIIDALTVRLAPLFDKELKVIGYLSDLAQGSLKDAMDFDVESVSLRIKPAPDY